MRKPLRILLILILAYLLQSIVLPFFRVNGVILDGITLTLYALGYACGYYVGLVSGLFHALMLEVTGGDLPGFITIACVGAGAFGAYTATKLKALSIVGNRRLEQMMKRFAPMVLTMLFQFAKESFYIVYFYLTGVDIVFLHIARALISAVFVILVSLLLTPLIGGFVNREEKDTLLYKWLEKRRERFKSKRIRKEKSFRKRPTRKPDILIEKEAFENDKE